MRAVYSVTFEFDYCCNALLPSSPEQPELTMPDGTISVRFEGMPKFRGMSTMLVSKDEWERRMFLEFAQSAGMAVDTGSISSGIPPHPDIEFTVGGEERWTELVEVVDQDLAEAPHEGS